ncbi:MAG: hypothetical protein QNJ97_26540, partial [Myxococcota bacterium]|nr:hypothetical protein [Myxococcota bacterium]
YCPLIESDSQAKNASFLSFSKNDSFSMAYTADYRETVSLEHKRMPLPRREGGWGDGFRKKGYFGTSFTDAHAPLDPV